jgi:hypothetical protein
MSALGPAVEIGKALIDLAAKHPQAVAEIGKAVQNIAASKDPLEVAKRATAATVSAQASEEILKRALGRSKKK